MQVTYNVTLRCVRVTFVAVGKEKKFYIFMSVCFVDLGIHHAMRVRSIISSSEACLVLSYFYTLSHKQHDAGGKKQN